jgi:Undecaprenyl-phosphate galactose phosphotransferase WbaP
MTQTAPQFPIVDFRGRGIPTPVDFKARGPSRPREKREMSVTASRSKRAFDLLGALALSILFAPLLGILYLIVRLDGGPAFFGHERVGATGALFKCWKFRTMVVNADAVLDDLLARSPAAAAEWERDFKLKDDPRITPIGRILRLVSLDELPQLWNVIRGEMSLVGPRPIVRAEMSRYGASIFSYLSCRPGLTGLWQVSGRNDLTYAQRVAIDTAYVAQWSIKADVAILLRTVGVMVNRTGAY